MSDENNLGQILEQIRKYLENPSEIVTGPRSTGKRADVVTRVKERCEEKLSTRCPLKEAEVQYKIFNSEGNNVEATVTITWKYDCCNIYEADASFEINDQPADDESLIMIEQYSIPEADPIELKPCQPCQPKCLKVQVTMLHLDSDVGTFPSSKAMYNIEVNLCPSKDKALMFDYTKQAKKGANFGVKRKGKPKERKPEQVKGK